MTIQKTKALFNGKTHLVTGFKCTFKSKNKQRILLLFQAIFFKHY